MVKKPRNIKFQLRLTEDESTMLTRQAARAGLTKTRYITYLIEREHKSCRVTQHMGEASHSEPQQRILVYKDADLRKIMWHLSKWGNNLNQATAALNAIAGKKFMSEAKANKLIDEASHRIELSEAAITKLADNIAKLQDEQHVVMGD